MIKKKNTGFTFIELIIAITIFSVIAVSIYSVLRTGVRLWYRVSPMIQDNQSFRLFFNTISRDLKNSLPYFSKDVNFEGNRDKVSFMTLVDISDEGSFARMEPAMVIYYYDRITKTVKRGVATRLEGLNEDLAKYSDILNNLEDKEFGFEYCYKLGSSKTEYEYEWKDEWNDKEKESGYIPRGVRIRAGDYSKTVFIPTGVLGGEDAF